MILFILFLTQMRMKKNIGLIYGFVYSISLQKSNKIKKT